MSREDKIKKFKQDFKNSHNCLIKYKTGAVTIANFVIYPKI